MVYVSDSMMFCLVLGTLSPLNGLEFAREGISPSVFGGSVVEERFVDRMVCTWRLGKVRGQGLVWSRRTRGCLPTVRVYDPAIWGLGSAARTRSTVDQL